MTMNKNDKKRSSVLSNRAGAHIKEVVNKFTTLQDVADTRVSTDGWPKKAIGIHVISYR